MNGSATPKKPPAVRTFFLTAFTLTAFAANSVLCRLALGSGTIDAAGFTFMRLLSAALFLSLLLAFTGRLKKNIRRGSWLSALMLFGYAACFSFAYRTLSTGSGALILFGAVQITMFLFSIFKGTRIKPAEWIGAGVAFMGFVYLVLPGVTTPSFTGFILMTAAGAAWGIYTLRGRGSENPMADTASNFLRTVPAAFLLILLKFPLSLSTRGVFLAVLSGAVTSGLGYTLWYHALRGLSTTRAAVVQLLVPVIAALGGVLFSGEVISGRLVFAALMILGGIMLVILGHASPKLPPQGGPGRGSESERGTVS